MGYNTTIVVLNDAAHQIEQDQEFGKKIVEAIRTLGLHNDIDIYSGNGNAAIVVETHHADETILIAVGGNCATVLGGIYGFRHNTKDTQIELLKMLATKLGYELKKRA